MMDYAGGLALAASGVMSGSSAACTAGLALGGGTVGVSLLTDYRLSLAKVIPIETHEVLDYVVGASAIIAPFALGYFRRARLASIIQIAVGVTTIVASMFTDYRAVRGRGRGLAY